MCSLNKSDKIVKGRLKVIRQKRMTKVQKLWTLQILRVWKNSLKKFTTDINKYQTYDLGLYLGEF